MKFIDWFAGIGGFRRGMELAGHECVGFCEFDKYAVMSYTSMHLLTDEQREHLLSMDLKKRQKEILKEEYRNGEWYANDIRRVYSGDIPYADCWCFGFPCQDISNNGKKIGFRGSRSSLFFRVMYLFGQLPDEEKPEWLFIENVKNLLSVNRGWDFARLLTEMDEGGCDAEWQVLNTKHFGVPQNRERVFIIGHLREKGERKILSFETPERESSDRLLANDDGWIRVIDGTKKGYAQCPVGGVVDLAFPNSTKRRGRVQDNGETCGTLDTASNHYYVEDVDRIRKLTPKECFRLQGWTDDYFEKAQQFNSDSQLYKQAGNGVTVNVIEAIARRFDDGIDQRNV